MISSFVEIERQVSEELAGKEKWFAIQQAIQKLTGAPIDSITLSVLDEFPFLKLELGNLGKGGESSVPTGILSSIYPYSIRVIPNAENRNWEELRKKEKDYWEKFCEVYSFPNRSELYSHALRRWIEKNQDGVWVKFSVESCRGNDDEEEIAEILIDLGIPYDEQSNYALMVECLYLRERED